MLDELIQMVNNTLNRDRYYIDDIKWNDDETVIQFEVFEVIDPTFSRGHNSVKSRGVYRFTHSYWREEEFGKNQRQQMKEWIEEEIETRFGEDK